jgi:hypothetical protein
MDRGSALLVTVLTARADDHARRALELLASDPDVRAGAPDLPTWLATGPPRRLLPVIATQAERLDLDERVVEASERASDEAWGLNERLFALAGPVIARLVDEGIGVVALKGLALIADVWPEHRRRAVGDADLLVRPSDATASRRLLAEAGWTTGGARSSGRVARARRAVQTGHPSGVSIDLHLRPTPLTPHGPQRPAVWDAVGPVPASHPLAATGLERPDVAASLVIGASHLAWPAGRLPHAFVDLARLRDACDAADDVDGRSDAIVVAARGDRVLLRTAAILDELAGLRGDEGDPLAVVLGDTAMDDVRETRIERRAMAAMEVLGRPAGRLGSARRALAHVRMVSAGAGVRAHAEVAVHVVAGWLAAR